MKKKSVQVPALVGVVSLVVPIAGGGERLDAFIASNEPRLSRSRTSQLVDDGVVVVDGVVAKKGSLKLRGGETIAITVPPPAHTTLVAQDLPLSIVYDDDDICVIEKAAGDVVHPGAGHDAGTIANALLFRFPKLSIGGERRPGIVHRLDKDTSGLLVVAKHDEALRSVRPTIAVGFRRRWTRPTTAPPKASCGSHTPASRCAVRRGASPSSTSGC